MITHKGTARLETPRLVLRKCRAEDAQYVFDNWASDPEVTRYMSWPTHTSIEVTESVIGQWLEEQRSDSFYNWIIVFKESGEPVGLIGAIANEKDQNADVGYCLSRRLWGKGFVPEALSAVIDFLFDEVGFEKIKARHCVENPNSGKVMIKCGMLHEGTARRELADGAGALHDAELYGILKGDRKNQ